MTAAERAERREADGQQRETLTAIVEQYASNMPASYDARMAQWKAADERVFAWSAGRRWAAALLPDRRAEVLINTTTQNGPITFIPCGAITAATSATRWRSIKNRAARAEVIGWREPDSEKNHPNR
jgi:hypothetical protein